MHSTKMLHFGLMRAEKMALTRIYKRVSYIPLRHQSNLALWPVPWCCVELWLPRGPGAVGRQWVMLRGTMGKVPVI
jgi:hypothetical protein